MTVLNSKSKNAPFGTIPASWEVTTIPDILLNQEGAIKIGPFGSQLKKDFFVEHGFKVYGQENAFTKDFSIGSRYVNKTRFNSLKSCELYPGDFIISMMGTIGKCAVVPSDIERGIMDSHLIRLQINDKKYKKELLEILIEEFPVIKQQIINLSVGGIMQGLSTKIIKQLLLPKPEIKEQEAIIKIFLAVSKSISHTDKIINKYKSIKQGLMQDLFSYGFDEKGQIRSEKTHKFKESPLGRIPEEWDVKNIKEITNKIWIGLVTTMTKNYITYGIPLIRNQNIRQNHIDPSDLIKLNIKFANSYEGRKLQKDDIVTVHTGDIGTSAIINDEFSGSHGFATINTRVNKNKVNEKFLCWYFNTQSFRHIIDNLATGDGRSNLNLKDFILLNIPVPKDLNEQIYIASVLENTDICIQKEEIYRQKLMSIKQGLMQDLLTGKVLVNHLLN